jgi:hypothetical protein
MLLCVDPGKRARACNIGLHVGFPVADNSNCKQTQIEYFWGGIDLLGVICNLTLLNIYRYTTEVLLINFGKNTEQGCSISQN